MSSQYGMSLHRKGSYLREQQRETKHAPRIFCKGPHIRNFEELCRIVYSPEDVFPDNTFKPEAISRTDLTTKGWSIQRVKYTERARVNDLITAYISRKGGRAFEYLLVFLGSAIRNIKDQDGYQAFFIVDHSHIPEDHGHAVILCAEKHPPSKIKELRKLLAEAVNNPQDINSVFP